MSDPASVDSTDAVLDLLEIPLMSWQRRVIHAVLAAPTPDELFYLRPPREQIRLGLDYTGLMEHFAIEVIRGDIT